MPSYCDLWFHRAVVFNCHTILLRLFAILFPISIFFFIFIILIVVIIRLSLVIAVE